MKDDCGHDAYCNIDTEHKAILGIADGVGVWDKRGVDAAVFPWALMSCLEEVVEQKHSVIQDGPVTLLDLAYQKLVADKLVEGGASTATVAIVDKETGILEVAALGDSALGVVRDFRFVAATDNTTQLRSYNCPNQFAIIPESYDHRGPTWDSAEDAIRLNFTLQRGDFIFLATDGYTDNIFPTSTMNMIRQAERKFSKGRKEANLPKYLDFLANIMVEAAWARSRSVSAETPYADRLNKIGKPYSGGKVDDITVIAAIVH